jgi:hypothetical protein
MSQCANKLLVPSCLVLVLPFPFVSSLILSSLLFYSPHHWVSENIQHFVLGPLLYCTLPPPSCSLLFSFLSNPILLSSNIYNSPLLLPPAAHLLRLTALTADRTPSDPSGPYSQTHPTRLGPTHAPHPTRLGPTRTSLSNITIRF